MMLSACGTPGISGSRPTSPRPDRPWSPPENLRLAAPADTAPPAELPDSLARLTLAQIVDLGLRTNPETRLAWANARAAAAAYGAARATWLPEVSGDVTASRLQTAASQGRAAVQQSLVTPSVSLNWLVFDLGGRTGNIASARYSLVAADFTHNAVIQDVIFQIEAAYFAYLANRALLVARESSLREAEENLRAAEERRRAGVATIADVLQARTAMSRARLAYQSAEGDVLTARGALAQALGIPATTPYDVDSTAFNVPIAVLADSVERLVELAIADRPDLQAARAEAEAAAARIGAARADRLPALTLSATGGRTYATTIPDGANSYNVSLGLSIPLFSETRRFDQARASALADAAHSRARALRSQVIFEVFSSYYALQTATRSVRTADDLVASATESNAVALARYRAGVGTLLDLLSAQSALADARAQAIQARLNWHVFLARLSRDAGVLEAGGEPPLRLVPDTTPTTPQR